MFHVGNAVEGEDRLARDVAKVKESLGPLPEPVVRPVLVMLAGLPGVGKTYFARRLVQRIPLAIVESDAVRALLFARPTYTFTESNWVFRVCHRVIEELLARGVPVLFDATNLAERHRELVYRIADRMGAKLIIVQLVAPPEVVRQRLEERATRREPGVFSEATWEVYERMRTQWEPIRRPHFVFDTSQDIGPAVARIAREILKKNS
jgi:predicted kinase